MTDIVERLAIAEQEFGESSNVTYGEAYDEIVRLREALRRCVFLLDGACTLPDGSNADTRQAHALLGDFDKEIEA